MLIVSMLFIDSVGICARGAIDRDDLLDTNFVIFRQTRNREKNYFKIYSCFFSSKFRLIKLVFHFSLGFIRDNDLHKKLRASK